MTALTLPVKTIFRKYDIRGIVDTTLTEDIVYLIGQGYAATLLDLGESGAIVARDTRLSSPTYCEAFSQALLDSGVNVTDIGAVPTPVANFAVHEFGIGNAVIVTGSHNPSNYNGLKLVVQGQPFHSEKLVTLYQRIAQGDFRSGRGQLTQHGIVPEYIRQLSAGIHIERPLRVAIDCGNGISGPVATGLLKTLGCQVHELFCEPDGRFPNHHPNPSVPENLQALQQLVIDGHLDIGLALDGDGDRLGVVDSTGKIIWPDRQLLLFAREILRERPGSTIVYDVKSTRHLESFIRQAGGVPLMVASGHSLLRRKMQETGAPLGGELSGHLFFNDRWFGFDDGLYTAARLLEILSHTEQSSSELFATLPDSPSTPEITIDFGCEQKLQDFMQAFQRLDHDSEVQRITAIDGLRIEYPHGWSLVRASNTTPSLSIRFEADDDVSLQHIEALISQRIHQLEPGLTLPF